MFSSKEQKEKRVIVAYVARAKEDLTLGNQCYYTKKQPGELKTLTLSHATLRPFQNVLEMVAYHMLL